MDFPTGWLFGFFRRRSPGTHVARVARAVTDGGRGGIQGRLPPEAVHTHQTGEDLASLVDRELRGLLAAGRKVEAIRRCRQYTGANLPKAKEHVDMLQKVGLVAAIADAIQHGGEQGTPPTADRTGGAEDAPSDPLDFA